MLKTNRARNLGVGGWLLSARRRPFSKCLLIDLLRWQSSERPIDADAVTQGLPEGSNEALTAGYGASCIDFLELII